MSTPITLTSSQHNPTHLARLPLDRSHHHGIIINYTVRHLGVNKNILAYASSLPLSLVCLAFPPSLLPPPPPPPSLSFSLSSSLPLFLSFSLPLFLSRCQRPLPYPSPPIPHVRTPRTYKARTNSSEKRHEPRPAHQRHGHGGCVLCMFPTAGL